MNPFMQNVLVAVLTGGSVAAILGFVQFVIKRHDDKTDKKSGIQAELSRHGDQLNQITGIVKDVRQEQEDEKKQIKKQGDAIAGLEHDRIVHVGKTHIQQHRITLEDYDDINDYLFKPYQALGGNGTAEAIMERLKSMVGAEDNKD